ncbi:Hypothetical protein SMAX5B_003466 [Scophthalmus maximus]|uniref:Uncharacterized protein n=1 Tax=Scophthalmus maximus TaxID=52904 RepID=A0A2U9CJJ4_SCOMX|nr:Hypothetical protein SMAX5B_003466 [Scophthalmus maximus]
MKPIPSPRVLGHAACTPARPAAERSSHSGSIRCGALARSQPRLVILPTPGT